MAFEVTMPCFDGGVEEALVVEWRVRPGERVEAGQPLLEVEADKASVEVTAKRGGVLLRILVQEGETAARGQAIALIGEEGEEVGG